MRRGLFILLLSLLATVIVGAPALAASPPVCFLLALERPLRNEIADDMKLLIGWTFDAAISRARLAEGHTVDTRSTFRTVPVFAGPTSMTALRGRYQVVQPFDAGNGYYGIAFRALDGSGAVAAVLLVNRLFRMPVALQDPAGLATDLLTNGAMLAGIATRAIIDAEAAALSARAEAERHRVPLITAGQSQAGGIAQVQVAYLLGRDARGEVPVGFITFNAAHALRTVRRLGLAGDDVPGVNFSKDRDPGVGPKALFANRIGLQVYIHPDGSAGLSPGDGTLLDALLHPREHLLRSFNDVSLSAALRPLLAMQAACG